ncbi:MAG: hypothetical protein AB1847_10260 [bacterium]
MLAVKGMYENGKIILQEKVKATKPVEVIVTFLEDVEIPTPKKLDLGKFSFSKARELLKDYQGSLSDAILEERRSEI